MDIRRRTGFWRPAVLRAAAFLLVPACWGAPGELRVCDDIAEPISLNPLKEFSEKHFTITQHIFDSLVRFDPEGRLAPGLAESWRWVDDLTLELKLRRGVKFHDGEAFDAESVRYSLARFTDPAGGFPGAGFLSSIAGVEAPDPATVRIKTRYPDGVLLHRLAGFAPMVPKGHIAKAGEERFGKAPVGTGAFRFERWEPGRRIVLRANKDYWDKGRPRFDTLSFIFLPVERQVEGLLRGDVDIVTELPGTATLKVMRSGAARIVKKESFYTVGGSINSSTGPLVDVRVRRALNHAIDREALIRYDLLGNGKPLATLSMPGEVGHDPGLRPYAYDPAKAKRLLREAGYPKGLRLRAVVKEQGRRTMQVIARQLARVGIEVEQTPTTDATVIKDIQSRPWDFTFGGCPDPLAHSFFVQFIFLSSLSPYSIQRNPAYDNLMQKMVSALDPAAQDQAGMEMDRFVYDQALSLFTYQRVRTYGVRKGIEFVPSVTGMPDFSLSYPHEEGQKGL